MNKQMKMAEERFYDITGQELNNELKASGFDTYQTWWKETDFATGDCVFFQKKELRNQDGGMVRLELQAVLKDTVLYGLSDVAVSALWMTFSEIQHATFMRVCNESIASFLKWVISGKESDAWG